MYSNDMKLIEIRDRGTLIPAFAIRMRSKNVVEKFMFNHCGYRGWNDACILLSSIEAPWRAARSWDEWKDVRTMSVAHKWIEENYDQIDNCQVVDVEFILGEKDKPSAPFWQEEMGLDDENLFKIFMENKDAPPGYP